MDRHSEAKGYAYSDSWLGGENHVVNQFV